MKTIPGNEHIAVVGFDCLLPGASNPNELWTMLLKGDNAVAPVPEELFDRKLLFDPKKGVVGRSYTDLAARIDYSGVDPERIAEELPFYSVSELRERDPSHIAYTKTVVEALKSAGMNAEILARKITGLYIGHATPSGLGSDYTHGVMIPCVARLLRELPELQDELRGATLDADRLADRLVTEVRRRAPRRMRGHNPTLEPYGIADLVYSAYHTRGPATVFNSSCASSLQAFAHGVMALRRGEVDIAVVGGASCFHANTLVLFSLAHSLSATGTAPFAERADGLILGEGYATVLLKRLPDALRDGDPIHAVVGSFGLSSDGKGKSLWAPLPAGQIECIRRAYPDPSMLEGLQYVECHATSTHLGDATELESLTTVLRESGLKKYRNAKTLPIGSVKRNIGHTLECSGLAGVVKVLLSMRHETIPATVEPGCELNKDVDWDSIPMYAPDRSIPWRRDGSVPRRAGVESFGIGGLNAHVVLDEYLENVFPGTFRTPKSMQGVAIVGRGLILPGAQSVEEFRVLLQSGKEIRSPIPESRWDTRLFTDGDPDWRIDMPPSALVEGFQYDWKRHKIPPKQLAQANPLQFMLLEAVDQTLQDAGYFDAEGKELKPFPREKTGCVVGAGFGGDFAAQLALALYVPRVQAFLEENLLREGIAPDRIEDIRKRFAAKLHERFPALVDETGSFTASSLASRVTKSYNLMGGGAAVDGGNGSVGGALSCCIDLLREGDVDLMLCLCGERDMTPERFLVYEIKDELETPCPQGSPLGRPVTGVVPGEGCVVFLLKRLEDARRDGDTVLGILYEQGTSAFEHGAVETAVDRAWRTVSPMPSRKEVAAVEVTGALTGKREKAIVDTLQKHYPGRRLQTRVGQFGYLHSVSASISLLAALEALADEKSSLGENRTVPLTTSDSLGRLFMAVHVVGVNNYVQHILLQKGTPVITTSSSAVVADESISDQIVFFDATARRRERLRNQAARKSEEMQSAKPAAPVAVVAEPVVEKKLDPAELEAFLVNFVVDQTGYPAEIVDLDVDLEADLGIDSIKKAQLFGEIGQYFEVRASDDMTLDQFPTLRSVMDFLLGQNAETTPVAPVAKAAPVETPAVAIPPANTETEKKLDPAELEAFLVNFVVDQTGYPAEIVDLDVDLEADLGIDSIKKAQLFGEIGQYFEVKASDDMTLDQFPTLRSVMDFLLKQDSGTAPSPARPVETVVASTPSENTETEKTLDPVELEAFLVNFVVDQTGYPAEIVDLDVDLEADLGIDSIKKAQLFGEIGQYFEVRASDDMTLDQFPTLRSVMNFLMKA